MNGPRSGHLVPAGLVVASMSSVQVGSALAVSLFAALGVVGTTWLRLAVAAVILLLVARPRGLTRRAAGAAGLLGLVMGGMAVAFSSATSRVPLGVAVAVEFCGPLALAAAGARSKGLRGGAADTGVTAGRNVEGITGGRLRALIPWLWPLLATAGVAVLTRPWALGGVQAARTWAGVGFAALAAAGWAAYIVLTAHVGRHSHGMEGLALAVAVAALALAPVGVVQAWPTLAAAAHASPPALTVLLRCVLAALLVPLGAYVLEMIALRRVQAGVFGVWMALEPALGALAGLLMLGQHLAVWQVPAVIAVVAAGVGAARSASAASTVPGPATSSSTLGAS
jgi:inner membrane transporter RhtA